VGGGFRGEGNGGAKGRHGVTVNLNTLYQAWQRGLVCNSLL
jgi:hypothetical protein